MSYNPYNLSSKKSILSTEDSVRCTGGYQKALLIQEAASQRKKISAYSDFVQENLEKAKQGILTASAEESVKIEALKRQMKLSKEELKGERIMAMGEINGLKSAIASATEEISNAVNEAKKITSELLKNMNEAKILITEFKGVSCVNYLCTFRNFMVL